MVCLIHQNPIISHDPLCSACQSVAGLAELFATKAVRGASSDRHAACTAWLPNRSGAHSHAGRGSQRQAPNALAYFCGGRQAWQQEDNTVCEPSVDEDGSAF